MNYRGGLKMNVCRYVALNMGGTVIVIDNMSGLMMTSDTLLTLDSTLDR